MIEANISCPTRNLTGQNFAMHEDYTRDCIHAIREKTDKPLWVKLSPNAGNIVSVALAAEDAGADCLVIANTFLSLKIRTDNFRPALGNKFGGLVSPGPEPIVLRMVYQVAKEVKIPIIGIGGVTKAEDVVEYMLAGASAVGIGYAGFRNLQRSSRSSTTWKPGATNAASKKSPTSSARSKTTLKWTPGRRAHGV